MNNLFNAKQIGLYSRFHISPKTAIMGDDTLLSPTIMGMIRPRREEEGGRGGVHDAGRGRAIA